MSVLTVERRDASAVVTLTRPEKLNALNDLMLDELDAALLELDADPVVRTIVLTGAGRGFCSGLDLSTATSLDELDGPTFLRLQQRVSASLTRPFRLSKPVIAAVNGPASGGGLALALASDIRIASESAEFNAAFMRIGLTGCDVGVSWLLPRIVGLGPAAEMMLTGRRVGAAEALRTGLVTHVTAGSDLLGRAAQLADEIAANSAFGVTLTKDGLRLAADAGSLDIAVGLENRQQALAALSPGYREAVRGFEKRWG